MVNPDGVGWSWWWIVDHGSIWLWWWIPTTRLLHIQYAYVVVWCAHYNPMAGHLGYKTQSRMKTAFYTPCGLYQFVTFRFKLFIDRVLRPHAAPYLYDVIIPSDTWAENVQWRAKWLGSFRLAGLTANLKKCAGGRRELRYLGYHLGGSQVRPQVDKTAAIAAFSFSLSPLWLMWTAHWPI